MEPIRELGRVMVFAGAALAAVGAVVWLAARVWYALAYWRDAGKRGPGFGLSAAATVLLILGALFGIARDFMLAG